MNKLKRKFKKLKAVFKVARKAHWSLKKANYELNNAKELGISNKKYIKIEGWKKSEAQLKQLASKDSKEDKDTKSLAQELSELSGMSLKDAKKELSRAKKYIIPKRLFVKFALYELTDKELKEYAKGLRKKAMIMARNNKFFIKEACRKSGLPKSKIIKDMAKMQKKGISMQKYVQKGVYGYTEAEAERLGKFFKRDKTRINNNREYYVSEIMKATGWSKGRTELEVLKAKNNCECSYEDYLGFKMWELTPEEQKTYVTLPVFDRMRIKYNEFRPTRNNFDNKVQFNKVFKKYINRVWFSNDNLTFKEFEKNIKGLKKIIVKPLLATCGVGVEAFEVNKSQKQNKEVYETIKKRGTSIIEEYIIQTKEMAEFCPTSVNTIRVYTIRVDGKVTPLASFIRMGNGGVVDNFHANGCAAGINIEKGVVETNAVDVKRNVYVNAPATGKKIKGFKIPRWKEILKICEAAAQEVDGVNLIGWDLAITTKGIVLIEGNPAGYYISQLINVEDRKGLMPVMVDPYL